MAEGSSWRSAKVPGAVGMGFSTFFSLLRARLKDEGLGRRRRASLEFDIRKLDTP